jgi:hypothetical protein
MKINLTDYMDKKIEHNGFELKPRDAYDTAKNIEEIFLKNAKWFRRPEPMHYLELRRQYKQIRPQMEQLHPGIIDLMTQPEIISQLGFPVDSEGHVSYPL